jgi:predicted nucleic acid-binding protein
MRRVFLDATCWVAAAGRPEGGSAKILLLAREGRLVIVTTQFVLQESERNIWEAFGRRRWSGSTGMWRTWI